VRREWTERFEEKYWGKGAPKKRLLTYAFLLKKSGGPEAKFRDRGSITQKSQPRSRGHRKMKEYGGITMGTRASSNQRGKEEKETGGGGGEVVGGWWGGGVGGGGL